MLSQGPNVAHYGSHLPGDLTTVSSEGPKPGEEGRGERKGTGGCRGGKRRMSEA